MGNIDLDIARSWLFVPGDRPDRFEKALASSADLVICDLEDAVAVGRKDEARSNVADWLRGGGRACVRINSIDDPAADSDLSAVAAAPGLAGIIVPKADDPDHISEFAAGLPRKVPIVALIETALGLRCAYEIAAADRVTRLAFGSIDFALDVGADGSDLSLLYARSELVVASCAAGVGRPIDGITTGLDNESLVAEDAHRARRLGFGGKLCVHPRQAGVVNAAFAPTDDQLRWAHRIVAVEADGGAQRVDGRLVDKPLIALARSYIQRAEAFADADERREL